MLNFQLAGFCFLLRLLWEEERASDFGLVDPPPPPMLPDPQSLAGLAGEKPTPSLSGLFGLGGGIKLINATARSNIGVILKYMEGQCDLLELDASKSRISRFREKLNNMTPDEYRAQARTLREVIEDDLKKRQCIYVKQERVELVERMPTDWGATFEAFPSAVPDIEGALISLAIGNGTACVFHLMRVAELGLRALARERRVILPKGRPLEWADWEEMLVAIQKKVDKIATRKRGPARGKALSFYRGVLGEFGAFKDVYRNNVMHMRESYDPLQARSVLNHVCEFMERLSAKIDETQSKQVAWGRMS